MFDPYYETKINPRWGRLPVGMVLGSLLVFIGVASLIFSIVDLCNGVTSVVGSAWQENSMWPTIGKGIWVGGLMIATGLVGFISQLERTQVSLYVFNALCWVSTVFSLFQLLSSILHVEPYLESSEYATIDKRTTPQNLEVAMNSLLIVCGGLGFLTSLSAGLLSCIAGNCFVNRRKAMTSLIATPVAPDLKDGFRRKRIH